MAQPAGVPPTGRYLDRDDGTRQRENQRSLAEGGKATGLTGHSAAQNIWLGLVGRLGWVGFQDWYRVGESFQL